jgi:hypothetical protein
VLDQVQNDERVIEVYRRPLKNWMAPMLSVEG